MKTKDSFQLLIQEYPIKDCIFTKGFNMIITIGREYGSGGHEIGERLADKYQIPFFDKATLVKAAKEKGFYDKIISFYDEKPVNSLLYAIAMNSYSDNIGRLQFDLVRSISEKKDFVMIGRCGNYIFKEEKEMVSVFIHSDIQKRIQRVREVYGIEEKNMKTYIERIDKQRASFHKFYTDQEWGDSRNYHLSIDSGEIGIDACTHLISEFIEKRKGYLR